MPYPNNRDAAPLVGFAIVAVLVMLVLVPARLLSDRSRPIADSPPASLDSPTTTQAPSTTTTAEPTTTTTERPTTTTTRPRTTTTTEYVFDEDTKETLFWTVVEPHVGRTLTRSQAVELAHLICDGFDRAGIAATLITLAESAVENNVDAGDLGWLIGAGTETFCPEHSAGLKAATGNL